MDGAPSHKRLFSEDHVRSPKRARASNNGAPEFPEAYSDAVRKKLSSASRTGQACDRCKERKMKCDTNPIACGPCRQKDLPCYTTDRVTGKAFERGQSDRLEGELSMLRRQVEAYQRKYGLLDDVDLPAEDSMVPSSSPQTQPNARQLYVPPAIFEGIDGDELYSGPVNGTVVDIFDGVIDIAAFACEDMEEYEQDDIPKFNNSKTSVVNTMTGVQRIEDPKLPTREQALKYVSHYLNFVWPYVPIVHRSSFIDLVNRFYDAPKSGVKPAERAMIFLVLAIISHQSAVRNPSEAKEKMEESNRWLHHGLGFYRDLLHDRSLASMQALTFIIVHTRNLPKPGFSWVLSHTVLVRAIDLNYHRSPDKVALPQDQNNPLCKELRKRVFWSILGICVTTGTKVGKPAPWHFQHIDCPVPVALQDTEVSVQGLANPLSGKCDFWIALHLFKLLPLLTELYNNAISIRQSSSDYTRTIESLDLKIVAWRHSWDRCIAAETMNGNLEVATLHIETWAAEYQLILHHPKLCTSNSQDIYERNLDICHKSARRLLSSFQVLSDKFKGADFTWHSTVAYALGFGATLQSLKVRPEQVNPEKFEAVKNELRGWLRVMSIADLVLRTGNFLYRVFEPRVKQLEAEYQNHLMASTAYNGFQRGHQSSTKHPSQTMQSSPKTNEYNSPIIYEVTAPPPSPRSSRHLPQQHQQAQAMPQNSAYAPYLNSASQLPATYSSYPPPQLTPHISQYQSPVPQSLAALLNDSPNAQGVYMPYGAVNARPQQPLMSFAQHAYIDINGNGAMWPNMIMEDPGANGQ